MASKLADYSVRATWAVIALWIPLAMLLMFGLVVGDSTWLIGKFFLLTVVSVFLLIAGRVIPRSRLSIILVLNGYLAILLAVGYLWSDP